MLAILAVDVGSQPPTTLTMVSSVLTLSPGLIRSGL